MYNYKRPNGHHHPLARCPAKPCSLTKQAVNTTKLGLKAQSASRVHAVVSQPVAFQHSKYL